MRLFGLSPSHWGVYPFCWYLDKNSSKVAKLPLKWIFMHFFVRMHGCHAHHKITRNLWITRIHSHIFQIFLCFNKNSTRNEFLCTFWHIVFFLPFLYSVPIFIGWYCTCIPTSAGFLDVFSLAARNRLHQLDVFSTHHHMSSRRVEISSFISRGNMKVFDGKNSRNFLEKEQWETLIKYCG